jgi:hypothetical protein
MLIDKCQQHAPFPGYTCIITFFVIFFIHLLHQSQIIPISAVYFFMDSEQEIVPETG